MSQRRFYFTIVLATLLGVASASADELKPEDFAEGMMLITEGAHPLYKLVLPEQVYRSVTSSDLADLRVFNSEGQAVPHIIKAPTPQRSFEEQQIELPVFPLDADAAAPATDWSLRIEVDGSLVSYNKAGEANEARTHTEWIIDLSKVEHPVKTLHFQFSAQSTSFVQKLHLAESQDLNKWHTLTDATLAYMQIANKQLTQDSVTLPSDTTARYLRVTAIDPADGFRIEKVSGTTRAEQHENIVQMFELPAASSTQTDQLEFDLGGPFKITGLKLQLPVPNSLFNVSLYSRNSTQADWQYRQQGEAYQLVLNGEQITDTGFSLNHTDRYWQVRFDSNATAQGKTPFLRVTWQPDDLYFVAQGSAPFTITYGNRQLTETTPAVHALLNQLNADQKQSLIGQAQAGPTRTLQGAKALEVKTDIPWTRWLLWSLLATGVALAARMAWGLKKEMSTEKK